jgi:hypothetical protein
MAHAEKISISLPKALRDAAKKEATRQGRSLSNFIAVVLLRHLKAKQ